MFSNVRFINESYNLNSYNVINENNTYIKNCNCFITESMIREYNGNRVLVEQSALLEGTKVDEALKKLKDLLTFNTSKRNKELENYITSLRTDLDQIIEANNIDTKTLKSQNKLMNICRTIINKLCGSKFSGLIKDAFKAIGSITASTFIGTILSFVIKFIINRLIKSSIVTHEYNLVKKDSEEVIKILRNSVKETDDENLKNRYTIEADRLEDSIARYSEKVKNKDMGDNSSEGSLYYDKMPEEA